VRKLKLEELGRVTVEEYGTVEKLSITVVLDNIRSALNVGSIFRTSDALALERVVLCGITPQPPSRDITKTAIGATETVDWHYEEDIAEATSKLTKAGYHIIIIEQTTDSIELMDYDLTRKKVAIVMGNEVNGISESILDKADTAIEIAQFGTKHSLNVSVCAGIVLHRFTTLMR